MTGYLQPVVLDTTVVSNFASTDSLSLLAAVLESPVVVPAVRDELERGLNAGHEYLDIADEWLDTWRERRGYYAPVESVTEILEDTK